MAKKATKKAAKKPTKKEATDDVDSEVMPDDAVVQQWERDLDAIFGALEQEQLFVPEPSSRRARWQAGVLKKGSVLIDIEDGAGGAHRAE